MNKSAIFKLAHALTKATIKAGDNYQATFGQSVKMIIAITPKQAMSEKQQAWFDKLVNSAVNAVVESVNDVLVRIKWATASTVEEIEAAQNALTKIAVMAVELVAKKSMQHYFDIAKKHSNSYMYNRLKTLFTKNINTLIAQGTK